MLTALRKFSSRTPKWISLSFIFLLAFVVLPSFPRVRNFLATPLVVHGENGQGDACYVLAGGGSLWERLFSASDLIHLGRVHRIILMKNSMGGPYNFKASRSWSRTQWEVDYLYWLGVPNNKIELLEQSEGLFGTLQEARNVAAHLPRHVRKLVVVSSAPHMRRTVLAFERSLPPDVKVVPYAATTFVNSYEMYFPLWLEYLKLLVYYVVA